MGKTQTCEPSFRILAWTFPHLSALTIHIHSLRRKSQYCLYRQSSASFCKWTREQNARWAHFPFGGSLFSCPPTQRALIRVLYHRSRKFVRLSSGSPVHWKTEVISFEAGKTYKVKSIVVRGEELVPALCVGELFLPAFVPGKHLCIVYGSLGPIA